MRNQPDQEDFDNTVKNQRSVANDLLFGEHDESDLSDLEEQDLQVHKYEEEEEDGIIVGSKSYAEETAKHESEDSDVEYESEDLEGNKKRVKGSKKRIKRKENESHIKLKDFPSSLNADAAAKVLEVRKDFDEAARAISNSRKRRRDLDFSEAESLATTLRDRMVEAAGKDASAHARRDLALHKLKLLPIVQRELARRDLHELYLDHHLLEAFLAWLRPLSDGSLPLYDIRKALFDLLATLPVATDHLRECRIGPLVMFYAKCSRETPEIRKIAQDCISKWSRPILNISDSYRDVHLAEKPVDLTRERVRSVLPKVSAKSALDSASSKMIDSGSNDMAPRRARVPIPNASGYMVRPVSSVNADGPSRKGKRSGNDIRPIDRTLAKLRGPSRRS